MLLKPYSKIKLLIVVMFALSTTMHSQFLSGAEINAKDSAPVETMISTKKLMLTSLEYLKSIDIIASKQNKLNVNTDRLQCQNETISDKQLITLNDVLQRSICKSPAIAQALMSIEENQFGVDLADSAFLPRLSVNGEFATDRIPSSNSGAGSSSKSVTGSLNLTWLLFDFGVRSANLEAARQTLSAAIATQDNIVLSTLIQTLGVYADALTAFSNLQALSEAEATAKKSMSIVQAQYDAKIVGLSEKMQAQTALARASLERSQANGTWITSRGQLAIELGLPVQSSIQMADPETLFSNQSLPKAEDLLEEAKNTHPRVRTAKAEISALNQRLIAINHEYKGSLNFTGNAARTQSSFDTGDDISSNNLGVSLQANIPLMTSKERTAREGQVQAQIHAREALVEQIQNELSNDIWGNTQEIETTAENLIAAKQLLEAASKNYEVSLGRYKAGVGTVSDLLIAQTSLANAQQQLQSSKISHIRSRIRLSMAVGRLSFLKPN